MIVLNRCPHTLLCLCERLFLCIIEQELIHEILLALHEPALLLLRLQVELHVASASFLIDKHVVKWGHIGLLAHLKGTDRGKEPEGVRG